MSLLRRAFVGLVLAAGGTFLWYVLFGTVSTNPVLAIVAVAVGVSLLGGWLPGTNGLAIGVVVGGIVGTAWLQVSVVRGTPLPPELLPPEWLLPELLEPPVPVQELLPLFLGIPAITYGLAGFVLGRRVGPVAVLVVGGLVAGSAILLPPTMDRLAILTAIVAAPVIVATLAAIGTDARLPSGQAE